MEFATLLSDTMMLARGAKIKFKWADKVLEGTFLRKNGGYYYFQVGDDKNNVVELYSTEFWEETDEKLTHYQSDFRRLVP